MEKLAGLGLVQIQPTRPKMFAALSVDVVVGRVVDIARERAERFAASAPALSAAMTGLRTRVRGRQPFVDLALGIDGHVRRHLVPLAAARKRILSYMERGDLTALDAAVADGVSDSQANREEHGGAWGRSPGHVRVFVSDRPDAGGFPQAPPRRSSTRDRCPLLG